MLLFLCVEFSSKHAATFRDTSPLIAEANTNLLRNIDAVIESISETLNKVAQFFRYVKVIEINVSTADTSYYFLQVSYSVFYLIQDVLSLNFSLSLELYGAFKSGSNLKL